MVRPGTALTSAPVVEPEDLSIPLQLLGVGSKALRPSLRRRLMEEAGLGQVECDVIEAAVASGDAGAFLDHYGQDVVGRSRLDDFGIVC